MLSESKAKAFLKRLFASTNDGGLEWEAFTAAGQEFEPDEELVGLAYVTAVAGLRLRLAMLKYKYWTDVDEYSWSSLVALDVVDTRNKLLWRFPTVAGIADLFELVKFRMAGVEDAIDRFLESPPADRHRQ